MPTSVGVIVNPGSTAPPTGISKSYPSSSIVKKWGIVLRLLELVSPSGNTIESPRLMYMRMSASALLILSSIS